MTTEFEPEVVVRDVTQALTAKYPAKDPAEVERIVRSEVDALKDRPVHDYVAVLAQRAAKRRLTSA